HIHILRYINYKMMKNSNEIASPKFLSYEHELYENLLKTTLKFNAAIEAKLRQFGLNLDLFNIMKIMDLETDHYTYIKDIQKVMKYKISNTVRQIRLLEERDLIERRPSQEDKRVVNVVFTEKG